MAAFVTGVGARLGSSISSFAGSGVCNAAPVPASAAAPTMRVLDGLDTVTQQPYTFSRYILGPFQGTTLPPVSGEAERVDAMSACYRHVFGNAYIMEEERAELAVAESQFKLGFLTVKEFVRALAKSYAYRSRFFEGASQYRFIELNFMHLLGRSPDGFSEMEEHNNRCLKEGYDAEIDSYLDSEEYNTVFGEDTVPFLRFRGAYTPCDSFNKQCALKGGWANSDKAMGGAALSGYNGSDGRQMSSLISSYVSGTTTPYEAVAENTPLKSTAPNWYAAPDPAIAPTPKYISAAEVNAAKARVISLQRQYDVELARKNAPGGKDPLAPFRAMTREMGVILDRGFAYSGGDPTLANPYAKLLGVDEGALEQVGYKPSDYKRYMSRLENDTLSRTERDLEVAKGELRVLEKAFANSTPVSPELVLPGQIPAVAAVAAEQVKTTRPKVLTPSKLKLEATEAAAEPKGPIGTIMSKLPSMPDLSSLNPFAKKE